MPNFQSIFSKGITDHERTKSHTDQSHTNSGPYEWLLGSKRRQQTAKQRCQASVVAIKDKETEKVEEVAFEFH